MAITPPAADASGSAGQQPTGEPEAPSLERPNRSIPLTLPVFFCRNGHKVIDILAHNCLKCREELAMGCAICSEPIGVIRDVPIQDVPLEIIIESMIEPVLVACKHAPQGCSTKLRFFDRAAIEEHENKRCEYRPVLCPLQYPVQCLHVGPGVTIPSHLAEEHGIPVIESCLEVGRPAYITMKATCPMTMLKTEKAWLLVNCWASAFNFGSHLFCSLYGSSTERLLHSLSIEGVRLRNEERLHLAYIALQAEAVPVPESGVLVDIISLEDILIRPSLTIPHKLEEGSNLEFDLKVTLLADDAKLH